MITLQTWRVRMSEDMRLGDFRPRTQEGYALAERLFLDWARQEPEDLTEDLVRAYFLYLRDERKQAPSSINIAVCALRFFFTHTLQRDWPVFELLRVHKPRMLPVVLSTDQVRAILGAVRHPVRRMALTTIYAFGLRLGEGLRLESDHIDSQRRIVWVRDGKGARDRGVPLPRPLLARLRQYWKHDRPVSPTKYLFVSPETQAPPHETTLQRTFTAVRQDISRKTRVHPHPASQLRHPPARKRYLTSRDPRSARAQVAAHYRSLRTRHAARH